MIALTVPEIARLLAALLHRPRHRPAMPRNWLTWRRRDQALARWYHRRIVPPQHGLVPIDFQDTVWGFEDQDLSFTVAALRRRPNGDRLVDAFRAGYGEYRTWPEVSPARSVTVSTQTP
jgi:hypothetical protein